MAPTLPFPPLLFSHEENGFLYHISATAIQHPPLRGKKAIYKPATRQTSSFDEQNPCLLSQVGRPRDRNLIDVHILFTYFTVNINPH